MSSADLGDVLLPTDNEWGVPVLRLDRQADRIVSPWTRWGRAVRKSRMRGTWHFYTSDYRFRRLISTPTDVINSGCEAAVECNFSVSAETTRAEALWRTFQKRRLARLWQDMGDVRIIVDLNVDPRHADLNMLGVPAGWKAYCTRGHSDRIGELEDDLKRARQRAGGSGGLLFVVYGGGRAVQAWAERNALYWQPEAADVERGRGA